MVVLDATYGAAVTLRLGASPEDEATVHALLAELTSGTAEATVAGEHWVDVG